MQIANSGRLNNSRAIVALYRLFIMTTEARHKTLLLNGVKTSEKSYKESLLWHRMCCCALQISYTNLRSLALHTNCVWIYLKLKIRFEYVLTRNQIVSSLYIPAHVCPQIIRLFVNGAAGRVARPTTPNLTQHFGDNLTLKWDGIKIA